MSLQPCEKVSQYLLLSLILDAETPPMNVPDEELEEDEGLLPGQRNMNARLGKVSHTNNR